MALYTNAVQKLYVAYFNRPADAAGLAYWEGVVAANKGDTSLVSAAFAASVEYQTEYSQITTAGVITKIYQNLFGHTPDTAGLAYWVAGIQAKNFTIDQAVTTIANGALTTDKVAFDSKVLVATSFTANLDTAAEIGGYTGTNANLAAKDFLSTIVTAADATAAIVPAKLDASIAAVVKAGVPFTLTGALTTLTNATDAVKVYLAAADGDNNAKTSTTKTALEAKVTAQELAIDDLVDGDYDNPLNSEGFKAALLADEIEERADALALAQKAVTLANTNIAKVAGMGALITADASADASVTAAAKVVTSTDAALQATVISYNTFNPLATITVAANGSVTGLIEYNATTRVHTLATGVTEVTNPGITAILTATVAKEAADRTFASASTVAAATQLSVDRSDFDATASGTQLLAVGQLMESFDLAANEYPTVAQINTETSVLAAQAAGPVAAKVAANAAKAAADAIAAPLIAAKATAQTNATNAQTAEDAALATYAGIANPTPQDTATRDAAINASVAADAALATATTAAAGPIATAASAATASAAADVTAAAAVAKVDAFKAALALYDGADNVNPLADALIAAEASVKSASAEIKALNDAIVKLDATVAVVTKLEALEDAVAAAEENFADHDFEVPVTLSTVTVATDANDIFVAGTANSTVFGMAGDDVLFVGAAYVQKTGALTTGNNAALEVFIAQSGANTTITIETEVYGSASGDVIVITLNGVAAADVAFANGIITV
ncbi:hypothetical protein CR105_13140 [Massilia eurypsychrophila]|uniref:DUF4214 domain-containing protein n=1 Tax=Massilia eurypsychrophila TaxID=1485217 RepID=A0A2G8TEB8_9BURK|nr:DUF4214 domain-containing protein [Massilia eurypsychrophila]PIL44406.1 hypothetical protein CR105_13140 [Massilia eurypsychrophila]